VDNQFADDTYQLVKEALERYNLPSCESCTLKITDEVIELWNEQGPVYLDIKEVIDHIINVNLLKKKLCI
tara:strand:- start:205 stop:414 length:210 start_codon:yes stop_codon:yes gene_type:complete